MNSGISSNVQIVYNLFEFETLIDLDLSVIMYIINNMNNSKYIDTDLLKNTTTINGLENRLLFRENINPLSIIIKKDYEDSIDDIYNELMESHKKEIVNNALPTDIMTFCNLGSSITGVVNNHVNCKDKIEEEYIHTFPGKIITKINEYDLSAYNTLYAKTIDNLFDYKNLTNKKIFILNTRYNMMKDYLIYKPEAMAVSTSNTMCIIDPYKNLTIPSMGGL